MTFNVPDNLCSQNHEYGITGVFYVIENILILF